MDQLEETEPKKKGMFDSVLEGATKQMQADWDRCKVCGRRLPPGTPTNKLYDNELGSLTVCVDCSLKAILWYVRNLYAKKG
jgi:hypothetical protein